jgi:flagellar biosynthesis protein FliR
MTEPLEHALNAADITVAQLEVFFLVLVRVSFIVFLLPFLNNKAFQARLKVGLSFFIAVMLYPQLKDVSYIVNPAAGTIFYYVLQECMVGILIGFSGQFLFAFVEFGGEIINREIGLSPMPVLNPATGENSTSMSRLIVMIFSIVFLGSGAHFFFFEALYLSFIDIPMGGLVMNSRVFALSATLLVSESILYGFRFAAPVFTTMFVSAVAMGFMSRIMPQMNIWIVSVPLKIFVGVVTLLYAFPLMYKLFQQVFDKTHGYMTGIIKAAGGAL